MAPTPKPEKVTIQIGGVDISPANPLPTDLVIGDTVGMTAADGADVTQGTTTDAAVTSDAPGTVIGFLRGLVKWAYERMPAALGQGTKAQSLPVTLASDEDALDVADRAARDLGKVDVAGIDAIGAAAGQATKANSFPVTLASDEDALDVTDRAARDLGKVDVAGIDAIGSAAGQATKANSLPVTLASDEDTLPTSLIDGADVTQGDVDDAAVVTDTTGTISGKLRGLVKWAAERMPASLGQKTKVYSLPVTLASDEDPLGATVADGADVAQGTTTDAAVVTDANGTVIGFLRGLVKLLVDIISVKIDQTTPGTTNRVAAGSALNGPGEPTIDSYASAVINLAASTADQELVAAPGANKQIWVYGLFMMADTAAGTVTLQDEDDAALSGTMAISDEGGWVLPISGNFAMPWIKVATNKALEADTGACTVDGVLTYAVVSV